MPSLTLHHIAILTTDLARSVAFYQDLFNLEQLERPPFKTEGVWLAAGSIQLHIVAYPEGTFRTGRGVDSNDGHFAFQTDDFEGVMERLAARGFREDAEPADPMRLIVFRKGIAGFPQVYLLDPDRNVVEVNGAEPYRGNSIPISR